MNEFLIQALTVVCGTAWTLAYVFIIIRSFRDKTYGMPFVALAFNFSWEVLFSTVLSDGKWVHLVMNGTWAVLDIPILVAYFMYGRREWPGRLNPILFYPYSILVLLGTAGFIYYLCRELHDVTGTYMAYIQNLMMSLLFINMINNRGNLSGQSVGVAVAKMIGTLAPTLLFVHWHAKFIVFCGLLIFFFDVVYLLLVLNNGQLLRPFRLRFRS
jgi:hypothetical protein